MENLFSELPTSLPNELTETLVASSKVRIERIVSYGHASQDGYWYDQDTAEWVVVLRGAARLRFEDDESTIEMNAGDWLNVAAHRRHRVDWTSPDEPTVWLAVFYHDDLS